ncbi:MAG: hypothetical protein IBX71_09555 [Candidatus Desulforudis sp.]|nr:hypothetical protein [Desulforudis sp.]
MFSIQAVGDGRGEFAGEHRKQGQQKGAQEEVWNRASGDPVERDQHQVQTVPEIHTINPLVREAGGPGQTRERYSRLGGLCCC